MSNLSLTLIIATKPPTLSKSFTLAADGTLQKHPGGNLVAGHARTLHATLEHFMRRLAALKPSQAFVYGICEHKTARIVPKVKLEAVRKAMPLDDPVNLLGVSLAEHPDRSDWQHEIERYLYMRQEEREEYERRKREVAKRKASGKLQIDDLLPESARRRPTKGKNL